MMVRQIEYKCAWLSSQMELASHEHKQRLEAKKEEMQSYLDNAHIELQSYIKKMRQERADLVSSP